MALSLVFYILDMLEADKWSIKDSIPWCFGKLRCTKKSPAVSAFLLNNSYQLFGYEQSTSGLRISDWSQSCVAKKGMILSAWLSYYMRFWCQQNRGFWSILLTISPIYNTILLENTNKGSKKINVNYKIEKNRRVEGWSKWREAEGAGSSQRKILRNGSGKGIRYETWDSSSICRVEAGSYTGMSSEPWYRPWCAGGVPKGRHRGIYGPNQW